MGLCRPGCVVVAANGTGTKLEGAHDLLSEMIQKSLLCDISSGSLGQPRSAAPLLFELGASEEQWEAE